MRLKSVLAFLTAAAVLLLAGCTGSVTGYTGRSAELGNVHYRINDRGTAAFAEAYAWDLDPAHHSMEIADTVEGVRVKQLGGYIGTGVPVPFRIAPEEGTDFVVSSDPSLESFDVPVTWLDL